MSGKMVSTTVYLRPDQDSLLKQLNQQLKVPVAELIRRGVDLVLEEHRDRLAPPPQGARTGRERR